MHLSLANGFTARRFVAQMALILLLSGIVSVLMAIFAWDMRLLFVAGQLAGIALLSTSSLTLSRFTQFLVLVASNILVGLIPFVFLMGYCYFQVASKACSANSITGYSFAFWVFPSIILWIPWLFTALGKTIRRYE